MRIDVVRGRYSILGKKKNKRRIFGLLQVRFSLVLK